MAEQPSKASMVSRARRDDTPHSVRSGVKLVPVLVEFGVACLGGVVMAVDGFQGSRGSVGQFIRCDADYGAVACMDFVFFMSEVAAEAG
jgi:hypothetical protein